jgi:hypothetical protein
VVTGGGRGYLQRLENLLAQWRFAKSESVAGLMRISEISSMLRCPTRQKRLANFAGLHMTPLHLGWAA